MPFTGYEDLISKISVGQELDWNFTKIAAAASQGAGVWQRLWVGTGTPGAGAEPATTPGTAYTNAVGSMNWTDQATSSKFTHQFGAVANQNCTLMLSDRLVGVSGISLASTGAKTINSAALPRYGGAAASGVQAWIEVTTATTVTAPVVNLNQYTNEGGTTGRAGANVTFPAAATVLSTMIRLPLQAGDLGIRSVEVGLNVVTAATAGACNVVLLRPLLYLPLTANVYNEKNIVIAPGVLSRVYDGASLQLSILTNAAVTTTVWGNLKAIYSA